MGINEDENAILFGEVKWSRKAIGTDIYGALRDKAGRVPWGRAGRREAYALFSRSGFTPDMLALARREDILLFHRASRVH